jgi:DNA primase
MQGRIREEDMAALRDRADIVDVISGYLQLRKAGRTFKGLCCFHQEKSPSMMVDPAKGLYHCFGCGAGGDVFTFVREVEGLSFNEAAQRLADRFGVQLRFTGGSDQSGDGSRRRLIEAHSAAAAFFKELFQHSPQAAAARKYLEGRGFNQDDAQAWGLGYSPPERDTLYRHLLGRKFKPKEIVDAGLATAGASGEHRDTFRNRLMFPVADLSGQVVGFGARALGDEQPKYLNSSKTPIYDKARILFGLDRSKAAIVKVGHSIVTEGYTDVIALHKVGMTNAVATCGTALGEDHFSLIKRFCDRAILAFDADAAGAVASERGFGMHAKMGLEVLIAPIPAGKDPADVALIEGADATKLIFDAARPLMLFVLEAEIARHQLDTAESKAKAVRAAAAKLAWEPNRVARGEHAFWVARRIGVAPEQVMLEISEASEASSAGRGRPAELRLPGHVKVEREALGLLLDRPEELMSDLGGIAAFLTEEHFDQPEHRVVFKALKDAAQAGAPVMDFLPDPASRRLAAELALAPVLTKDEAELFARLEEFRLARQTGALRAKLDRLDPSTETAAHDAAFEELMRLEDTRRGFER